MARNYGHESTVCVCTSSHCDTLKPLIKTSHGLVSSYVSSLDGDRFHHSELNFTKSSPSISSTTIQVTLDSSKLHQKIIGFGGAFTDASGINIAKLPKPLQERLIRDYYASDGIEYTLGRIPIGGSDFSTRPYSYDDHPGDESLSKFALEPEDLNYKVTFKF